MFAGGEQSSPIRLAKKTNNNTLLKIDAKLDASIFYNLFANRFERTFPARSLPDFIRNRIIRKTIFARDPTDRF